MDDRKEIRDVAPGEFTLKASGEYNLAEEGEPIKAHIKSVKAIETENFDKTEMVTKAVVAFELDEGEGQGQVYTKWFTPTLHPKGTLLPMVKAVFGDLPEEPIELARDLPGKPLRIVLKNVEGDNGIRQNIDGYLKATKDQKTVDMSPPVEQEVNLDDLF